MATVTRRANMSAVPKQLLTAAEYLAKERKAEFKSEFFRGEMFAMAGASREHNRVKDNLIGELHARLKGGPCQSFSSDQRVMVDATGLYTYPDVVIVCGAVETDPADRDTITNPTAIIEIQAPDTWRYDRVVKFRSYLQILSLREYVLVAEDEPVIDRFMRQADGSWALVSFVGLDTTLTLTSISASIPLIDVYAGITFINPPIV
jgi:Uma2 family endonuclease